MKNSLTTTSLLLAILTLTCSGEGSGATRVGCTLNFGGALGGQYACRSPQGAVKDGHYVFAVTSLRAPSGAPRISFEIVLKGDPGAGTYTLADMAMASLKMGTSTGRSMWLGGVSPTAKPSGSLSVTLSNAGRNPHGTLSATLPCLGLDCTGEAKVDATF